MPRVELLYWDGCPSHPAVLDQLQEALVELGHSEQAVELVRVETDSDAARLGFVGSPTIRVDGADPLPPPTGEPTVLACRVYRLRDGRFSPTPDPDDLREGLATLLENGDRS